MKILPTLALAATALAGPENFDAAKTGTAPDGWTLTQTGEGTQGTEFTVTFNGVKVLQATDDSLAAAGRAGVWTKADSVTRFDDFLCGEATP